VRPEGLAGCVDLWDRNLLLLNRAHHHNRKHCTTCQHCTADAQPATDSTGLTR